MKDFNLDWQKGYEEGLALGMQRARWNILEAVLEMEQLSHRTRTPIYQDTFFKKMKDLLAYEHPPKHFRDASNGE
jgi:hypothetical protein